MSVKQYHKMYLRLFNAVTDALKALEENRPEQAKILLIQGQQECETLYLEEADCQQA